jgi:hypothetical protein
VRNKLCAWCNKPVNDKRCSFCSLECFGKARANRSRTASPPPPVVGAAWLPLADGRFALIDEDLYAETSRYSWSAGGSKREYAKTVIGGRGVYLHHMVLPGGRVDHRNGNTLDCRRENLRPATQRQNTGNTKSRSKKSPYKGIQQNGSGWAAQIRDHGKRVHVGQYKTAEEAARAYDAAAREVHGEFACVNFPNDGERGALH